MNSAAPQTAGLADYLDIVEIALATISRRLPATVGRDDLASAGKLALVVAVGRREGSFDDVRAYCFVRVRGAMLDELRRLDPLRPGAKTNSDFGWVESYSSTGGGRNVCGD